MTDYDRQYIALLKEILNKGIKTDNRTGIGTLKIPSWDFFFDIGHDFPILQTKKIAAGSAIREMLWIWQMQSNDVRDLHSRNIHIWDEWMIDPDGIYRVYEPEGKCPYDPDREVPVLDVYSIPLDNVNKAPKLKYTEDGQIMTAKSLKPGRTIKFAKWYGKDFAYTIGTAYGFITARYKFAQNLIDTIKHNPTDRRIIKSLWQDEFLRTAVLPSCVWSTEWDVNDGYLNLIVHQRSCDVPLGLPFNVTQYAALQRMIAQVTNMKVGFLWFTIKDAHIYENQLEGVYEQLRRAQLYDDLSEMSREEVLAFQQQTSEIMKMLDTGSLEYRKANADYMAADLLLKPCASELLLDPSVDDFFEFDYPRNVKVRTRNMGGIKFPIAQ